MQNLKTSDPDIWEEFLKGNFTVNKTKIPFCVIGVDQALEHVNRMMKVSGGIVGITLNPSECTHFFLTAPELA